MPAYPWQQVYKAVVLERDPSKLEEFIHAAFIAIYEHLRARGNIAPVESKALSDACILWNVCGRASAAN